jgi:hypothetical protein
VWPPACPPLLWVPSPSFPKAALLNCRCFPPQNLDNATTYDAEKQIGLNVLMAAAVRARAPTQERMQAAVLSYPLSFTDP